MDLNEQFKLSMPKNEGEDSPSREMDEEYTRIKLKLGTQRVDLAPEDGEATYDSAMNEIQRQVTELASLIESQQQGQQIKSMTADFIEDYRSDLKAAPLIYLQRVVSYELQAPQASP